LKDGPILLINPAQHEEELLFDDVLLIRITSDPSTGTSVVVREPLAVEYLAAFVDQYGYDPLLLTEGTMEDEEFVPLIHKINPSIVGISMHTSHLFHHAMELAAQIKNHNPDTVIITGGYHPTGDPSIALDESIDFVVIGEGEKTFLELLDYLTGKSDINPRDIKGIAFKDNSELVITPKRERIDFSEVPSPRRDKEILKNSKCAPLAYPPPHKQVSAAQISYSRGCPYMCPYCASALIWGKHVSYREVEDVVNEIKYLKETFGTNFLFFTDLTFNLHNDKARELCDSMIEEQLGVNWFAYSTVDKMNPKIGEVMRDAGCSRVGVGIESIHDTTLKKIKPHQNFEKTQNALTIVNDLGMLNRSYFMVGWPWETKETLKETYNLLYELPIDQVRFAFVVPFPGTPFYNEYRDYISEDFDYFTGDKPVLRNDSMSGEELKRIVSTMLKDFYNSEGYANHIREKVRRYPHLRESFKYFEIYLKKRNILAQQTTIVD
jgi:radical SAM superfamily enzyme YgiQ (UPF0313 family)